MFAHRKGSSVLGAGLLALAASSAIVSSAVLAPAALRAQDTSDSGSLSAGLAAYEAFKYDDAARILKPLADAGEAEAQYTMAMLHMMGEGVAESPAAMVAYATKADKQGHMGARTLLAQAYLEGLGVSADEAKGIKLLQSVISAKTTSPSVLGEAHEIMALAYEEGMGVSPSPKKALDHYRKSYAARPDEFVLLYLVTLLDDGHGGSFEQEIDWYRRLAALGNQSAFDKVKAHADKGDAHSQYIIGNVYSGVAPNGAPQMNVSGGFAQKAKVGDIESNGQYNWEYWERAAKGGIGDAAVASVGAFTRGFPSDERLEKASHWLKTAPGMKFLDDAKRIEAHTMLANAYLSGNPALKITRDLSLAEKHYRAAGNGDGLNEVAKAHFFGKDTPKDIARATAIFKDCAAMDDPECQFNLALGYVTGQGVEKSFDKAVELFERSYANGYIRAKSYADDLRRRGSLPDVSPDQITG